MAEGEKRTTLSVRPSKAGAFWTEPRSIADSQVQDHSAAGSFDTTLAGRATDSRTAMLLMLRDSDEPNSEHLLRLHSLTFPPEILHKKGYVGHPLSATDLERKKRCARCNKIVFKPIRNEKTLPLPGNNLDDKEVRLSASRLAGQQRRESSVGENAEPTHSSTQSDLSAAKPTIRCREFHQPLQYSSGELERLWQFHPTSEPQPFAFVQAAVAIDCEMGVAKSGDSELIRVTLIDYFSKDTLLDSLVYPDVEMLHYNTRYSGVTRRDIETARKRGKCIRGRDKAREAVWRFVGPNTVVIGHSANNDLTSLRWIHPVILDTFLIESALLKIKKDEETALEKQDEQEPDQGVGEGVSLSLTDKSEASKNSQTAAKKKPKGSGQLSLRSLSMARLNRSIQNGGKLGHDSMEDALAARDLAHWHVTNTLSLDVAKESEKTEVL